MTAGASYFSPDYGGARARFRDVTERAGFDRADYAIGLEGPQGEPLSIDFATKGAPDAARKVVVSSGLHGVEGFFGSAAQLALLDGPLADWTPPDGCALVLIHALNPYGFAWLRRVNEDNIDLNRNFLFGDQTYRGSPDKYEALDALLNPASPPASFEPFLAKAGLRILRHGLPALKSAVAGGQYDFPKGLFFGGSGKSKTFDIVEHQLPEWVGRPEQVIHVDYHTGLGKPRTYKLMVDHPARSPRADALATQFGADVLQPWDADAGVAYAIKGGMGQWCQAHFTDTKYDVLTAEFGTYPVLKVLEALRAENRAHLHGRPDGASTKRAKAALREVFAPAAARWRDAVVAKAVAIAERAMQACFTG